MIRSEGIMIAMMRCLFRLASVTIPVMVWLARASAAPAYFPPTSGEWGRIEPARAGWNTTALDAALDFAGASNSSGVVVLVDGRILAERHWTVKPSERYTQMFAGTSANGHAIEDVASIQKSVVAFLAGIAEGRRQLDLTAPVDRYLGKGWSKAPPAAESAITVRHLMTMTSGLTDAGVFQQAAGQTWRYNTGMYSKMIAVLERVTGSDIEALTRRSLTGPIGMTDSRWVRRPWSAGNNAANTIGFATTARDLARFGLMVLADGTWDGKDLLGNPGYFGRMLKPSQDLNPSYGLLWWLNGQRRVPSAPPDLVAADGALDRKLYVVPSMRLVVARLGAQTSDDLRLARDWDDQFWKLLMKAAP